MIVAPSFIGGGFEGISSAINADATLPHVMESMGIIADTSELIKKDVPLPLPWGRARPVE